MCGGREGEGFCGIRMKTGLLSEKYLELFGLCGEMAGMFSMTE